MTSRIICGFTALVFLTSGTSAGQLVRLPVLGFRVAASDSLVLASESGRSTIGIEGVYVIEKDATTGDWGVSQRIDSGLNDEWGVFGGLPFDRGPGGHPLNFYEFGTQLAILDGGFAVFATQNYYWGDSFDSDLDWVSIYAYENGVWAEADQFDLEGWFQRHPDDVATDGDILFLGGSARRSDGGAVLFLRSDFSTVELTSPRGFFGSRLEYDRGWLFVSSAEEFEEAGAVLAYKIVNGLPSVVDTLTSEAPTEDQFFGRRIGAGGGTLAVSSFDGAYPVQVFRHDEASDTWSLSSSFSVQRRVLNVHAFGDHLALVLDSYTVAVYHRNTSSGVWDLVAENPGETADLHGNVLVIARGGASPGGDVTIYEFDESGSQWDEVFFMQGAGRRAAITGSEVTCTNGEAAGFPCDRVHLSAYLPNESLGRDETDIQALKSVWGWTDDVSEREFALAVRGGLIEGVESAIAVVEITDPTEPRHIANLTHSVGLGTEGLHDVKVVGDHAVAVLLHGGLLTFDLTLLPSITSFPSEINEAGGGGRGGGYAIAVNEETGFAYVTGNGWRRCDHDFFASPLTVNDLSNMADPMAVGCFGDPELNDVHGAHCVVYRGPDPDYRGREICFLSQWTEHTAFQIVDFTDKSDIRLISSMGFPGAVSALQGRLSEDHRYFVQNHEGRRSGHTVFIDVTDLDSPQHVGSYEKYDEGMPASVSVHGRRALLSKTTGGLRVIDFDDPTNPFEVGFFDVAPATDHNQFGFGAIASYRFPNSGTVVVASVDGGLFVLRPDEALSVANEPNETELPTDFFLSQNYPNPFNPTTTITYALPQAADVTLTVYDVLGRQVEEFASGTIPAGTYEVSFDATGLSSGVYFYRLQAGDYVETKRMVIVR